MSQSVNLETEVAALFHAKMEEFVAWCCKNWKVTEAEAMRDNVFDGKPPGYRDGYNAAIDGLDGALEMWIEEQQS